MNANNSADADSSAIGRRAAALTALQIREAAQAQGADSNASGSSESEPKEPKPPRKSPAERRADADSARLALAQTLDAIEDKVNVPKQAKLAAARIETGLRKAGDEQPVVLLAVAAGVAALVGAGVWWLASRFTRD